MGFLEMLQKKPEKKNLGVCIPEHMQKKIDREIKEQRANERILSEELERAERIERAGPNSFEVQGLYAVQDTLMVNGFAVDGTISKGAKTSFGGKELKVKEIQFEGKTVNCLRAGQQGALFLSGKKFPIIKADDILEFE